MPLLTLPHGQRTYQTERTTRRLFGAWAGTTPRVPEVTPRRGWVTTTRTGHITE
ncbi:hypothetical protein GCM10022420_023380 [Streptomyces iranensis]